MKKLLCLMFSLLLALSLVACGNGNTTTTTNPNEGTTEPEAVSSATLDGTTSLAFGTIKLEANEMELLLKEMAAGPFRWPETLTTGNGNVQTLTELAGTPKNRDMYIMGTTFNNVPNAAVGEFVMDAENYKFYGQSESETSKMYDIKTYPDVTLTWVAQLDTEKAAQIGDYGFLHGFIVYGKAHIYTVDDLNPSNAEAGFDHSASEEAVVRYMDIYMPSYYPTRWDFPVVNPDDAYDYTADPDYAEKVATAEKLISESAMTLCYEIKPERVTISYFSTYSPGAITETAAWSTYANYADAVTTYGADGNGSEGDGIFAVTYTGYDTNRYVEARTDAGNGPKCAMFYWEDDGTNPDWVNPFADDFNYFNDSIFNVFKTVKERWLAEPTTEQAVIEKAGADDTLTFTRFVSNTEKAEGTESYKVLTAEEISGLTQGKDYHVETITLPNYSKELLLSPKTACGIFSQSNLLFDENGNTTTSDKKTEEVVEVEDENDGSFAYNKLADGSYEVLYYFGESNNVIVPAEFNGAAVTKIADGAFKDNDQIATLVLPETLVEIGNEAFYRLRKVRQIEVPETVTKIGNSAFFEMGYGTQGGAKSETYVIFNQYTPEGIEMDNMLGENIDVSSMQVRIKVPTGATKDYQAAWSQYEAFITETINQ